ncbi:uncharacterized protein B0I36DRAFT_390092 [Microdochium trichocladiopsis]|uniref:FAD-binding PCMH-type domain-containing protein n=1 Tax=Microdochium trichocladiopsis TaxID=1682393 RepID=A0A9P9BVB6_9PEZI|nr:uncharacterized protein B0I36DRAFT_390092 [Microdochium trichocladiopsis]KAH7039552.1 hypothetical protein B0I36DRAFT_390092 [Microdochium trichocladiopsis]
MLYTSALSTPTLVAAAAAALVARLAALPPPAAYISELAAALPGGRVVLPQDQPEAFTTAIDGHFSLQNRDMQFEPACVVQPRDVDELSIAVRHLAREHTLRRNSNNSSIAGHGLFAVRCTGANPAQGVAGARDGVLLDLSRLSTLALSADQTELRVGGGCTWEAVYHFLDPQGLTVVGGRSTPVGVGGSTLGGGISYFSGHRGLMCSNVVRYTVVLADGRVVVASEAENADLWRALKGGLNNFGVVAEFSLRVCPGGPVWLSATVTPAFLQSDSVLRAYHDDAIQAATPGGFDPNVATPILSLAHMPALGMSLWVTQLFYTVLPSSSSSSPSPSTSDGPRRIGDKTWPAYWRSSPLGRRIWGIRTARGTFSHADAVRQNGLMSPAGLRQAYCVTGFRMDLPTLRAAVAVFDKHKTRLSALKATDTAFCIVFQTLNPRWVNKGDPNSLGLEGDTIKDPVVIVLFCCSWVDVQHDGIVKRVMQDCVDETEAASRQLGSEHRYRFANYASEWQRPLGGYGEENLRFLREVSKQYDPEGLFQTGCLGGYKLGREDL